MATELQQTASRTNGAKSHGPVSDKGRLASSQNARRHGLLSTKIPINNESQEEFQQLLDAFLQEHQPQTQTELDLVEKMAVSRWQQERTWTLQRAAMNEQMRRPRYHEGEDPDVQSWVAFRTLTDDSRAFDLLNRYETRFERQFRAALTALLTLRAKNAAARAAHPASPGTTRHRLFWVDEEGNETLAADSHPDPEPAPESTTSGSFGNSPAPAENTPFPAPFEGLRSLYRSLAAFVRGPETRPSAPILGDRIA